ncbi:aspartyl glutamyl-trna(asn gln) c subunit [Plasmopara halstedii]|uniref:Aspartyl glutamyl-trna(Asn gln) c subunit n=1 Tax=Plasmopara halstedii TaxID=4781 RepID=A0A0N7L3R3_PLAHL|nr:aspartyl glutamyl-trna(asn gln) c subunit [Plasmopara halstedii]CEG36595.1 aspartyl glutamyl-trna(asn gln) c subunit [Plasmopara halstedii]|eukprot:XP_024572964.1 aspartyl glutamyl-trna(asn gln) c subunit [Plasmopara halstedii]
MIISVARARKFSVALRRASQARCASSVSTALPEGLHEITCVPRTPSWSLKELHSAGAQFNAEDAVLTEEKLRELADLCHLHLDDDRIPKLLKGVESIIQCTKTVQAMTINEKIEDVYAKHDFGIDAAPLRDDIVTEGDCAEELLANAAVKCGYYFKVPKVLQD